MAIKMYLPGGGTTDIVALSLPVFFTRTPTDLLAFNEARRPDPSTGQPDVEKVGAYVGLGFKHLVFHAPGPDQEHFLKLFGEQVSARLRKKFG
jgi:hypothetical protein